AFVVAVQTPYFAVTDKEGNYIIKDVPPGKYTLKVWHEKRQAEPQEVEVPEKGEVTVNFELSKRRR
ncbi:MAG: carboxypeptidase regulatory-like domain-containing protein, partial [Calditrichaeota bacterium]